MKKIKKLENWLSEEFGSGDVPACSCGKKKKKKNKKSKLTPNKWTKWEEIK
mgnify:CR=1 FL=1